MSPIEDAITPKMDKIASKGIRFTNAYSQYANCAPSNIINCICKNIWQHSLEKI